MYSQWLKLQFDQHPKKTKKALADALGLDAPAVSKILKGTRQVKAHEYTIMRRFFGLPVDGETTVSNKNSYIIKPLVESSDGFKDNATNTGPNDNEWIIPSRIIERHTDAPPDKVKILEIKESLMEPDFRRGEYVVVDLSDQKPSPPGVFIVSDGFGYLLRQCEFIPNSAPPKIKISAKDRSFQPHILTHNDFNIIGRVIGKVEWIN